MIKKAVFILLIIMTCFKVDANDFKIKIKYNRAKTKIIFTNVKGHKLTSLFRVTSRVNNERVVFSEINSRKLNQIIVSITSIGENESKSDDATPYLKQGKLSSQRKFSFVVLNNVKSSIIIELRIGTDNYLIPLGNE